MGLSLIDDSGVRRPPCSPHAPRVLIYSHDTFGLGHIRRCRAIARRVDLSAASLSSGMGCLCWEEEGDGTALAVCWNIL